MAAFTFLSMLLAAGQPMDWLLGRWDEDEATVRDDVSREIVDRWREWDDMDMLLLEQATGHPDPEVASRARRALAIIGIRRRIDGTCLAYFEGIDRIILEGGDGERIGAIARAAQGPGPVLEALMELAEEHRWRFRVDSLEELMKHATAPVVPLLLPYFEHPDPTARLAAISNVMPHLGIRGLRFIEPMLRDGNDRVRYAALVCVEQLHDRSLLPGVIPLIDDPDGPIRGRALELAVSWGYPISVAGILERLPDPDPKARASKVWALGTRGSREHAEIVARHLDDPDMEVRVSAVGALADLLGRDSFDAIIPRLDDARAEVRTTILCAVWALGAKDAAGAVGAALPFLRDPDEEVARTAARVVAGWEPALLGPVLREMLGADDAVTRRLALTLLDYNSEIGSTLDLERALYDPVASIRSEAFRILRERRAEGHLEAMAGALADPDPQVRKQAALFIDQACAVDPSRFGTALLDLLDDPVTETRIAAIRRAIALDAADRVPALIELLADADEDVRAIAEQALCRIARPEHLWLLHAATARGEGARGAMVQAIGREPGRPLTPLARIDDEKVWRRVLEAAAAETPAERILLLAPLLKHTEEWVCEETMRAIALTLGDLLWTDPI